MTRTVIVLITIVVFSLLQFRCSASSEVSTDDLQDAQLLCQITQSDGTVISHVELDEVPQDSLVISGSTRSLVLPVDSIAEIRFVSQNSFWKGARTGALIGGAVGFVGGALFSALGPRDFEPGQEIALRITLGFLGGIVVGTFFSAVGGTVGGVAGFISDVDEVYDLSGMTHAGKLKTIQTILSKKRYGSRAAAFGT